MYKNKIQTFQLYMQKILQLAQKKKTAIINQGQIEIKHKKQTLQILDSILKKFQVDLNVNPVSKNADQRENNSKLEQEIATNHQIELFANSFQYANEDQPYIQYSSHYKQPTLCNVISDLKKRNNIQQDITKFALKLDQDKNPPVPQKMLTTEQILQKESKFVQIFMRQSSCLFKQQEIEEENHEQQLQIQNDSFSKTQKTKNSSLQRYQPQQNLLKAKVAKQKDEFEIPNTEMERNQLKSAQNDKRSHSLESFLKSRVPIIPKKLQQQRALFGEKKILIPKSNVNKSDTQLYTPQLHKQFPKNMMAQSSPYYKQHTIAKNSSQKTNFQKTITLVQQPEDDQKSEETSQYFPIVEQLNRDGGRPQFRQQSQKLPFSNQISKFKKQSTMIQAQLSKKSVLYQQQNSGKQRSMSCCCAKCGGNSDKAQYLDSALYCNLQMDKLLEQCIEAQNKKQNKTNLLGECQSPSCYMRKSSLILADNNSNKSQLKSMVDNKENEQTQKIKMHYNRKSSNRNVPVKISFDFILSTRPFGDGQTSENAKYNQEVQERKVRHHARHVRNRNRSFTSPESISVHYTRKFIEAKDKLHMMQLQQWHQQQKLDQMRSYSKRHHIHHDYLVLPPINIINQQKQNQISQHMTNSILSDYQMRTKGSTNISLSPTNLSISNSNRDVLKQQNTKQCTNKNKVLDFVKQINRKLNVQQRISDRNKKQLKKQQYTNSKFQNELDLQVRSMKEQIRLIKRSRLDFYTMQMHAHANDQSSLTKNNRKLKVNRKSSLSPFASYLYEK